MIGLETTAVKKPTHKQQQINKTQTSEEKT